MRLRAALVGLTLACATAPARGLDAPLVFVQTPVAPATGGSRLAVLAPDGEVRVLTPGFADAADPSVSFDGRQVLFAGRRGADDGWEIWRIGVDGSGLAPVTHDLADARAPVWLAPAAVDAPTFAQRLEWIACTSTAARVWDEAGRSALANLYAVSLQPAGERGIVRWQTTYGLGGDRTPTVLADGRVLFASWHDGGYGLLTISWAGENLNPFYGSHDGTWSQVSPVQLPAPSSDVVFVEVDGARPRPDGAAPDPATVGGRLAAVSMRRPLHSHRVLAEDGAYRTPAALADGRLVVAWRGAAAPSYGLYEFDLDAGRGAVVIDDPAWDETHPAPAIPRPVPRGRIPTVAFASVLDVPGFASAGQLQCLNVYDSDRPELAGIAPGRVARVRLVEGVPTPLDEAPAPAVRRSLGEAPVEADGSFYVNVAGDRPFTLQTLDADGGVVAAMDAWIWVRAGDQRGCVGCHENKELAPENRVTDALRRAQPESLMGQAAAAGAP